MQTTLDHVFLPHLGWMCYEPGDPVARSLRQNRFDFAEQAFLWLFLKPGHTVVDCGAHAGLFSVLAGRLVGPTGRILAIEPSSGSANLLRENLAAHNLAPISILFQSAAGSASASIPFVDQGLGKSPFNHLDPSSNASLSVPVQTLPALLASADCSRADFLKINANGAEVDILAGAMPLIQQNAFPVLMVHFNQVNLQRAGQSTESLYHALSSAGYSLHRFDPSAGQLVPRLLDTPISHENIFAVHQPDSVGAINLLLRNAPMERRRIAWDIVQRGLAAFAPLDDQIVVPPTDLQPHHDTLLNSLSEAQEKGRLLSQQLAQAQADLADTRRNIEQFTLRQADLIKQLQKNRSLLATKDAHLQKLCSSPFQRLSWMLHLQPKPAWVDQILYPNLPDDNP
ncbi:MAG TPA: FkbM family methyltransferase [Tepidisphaeraceae bacterium]|jgi:FkbM family methyltransferase|nr:FkbM family methyltransferase [Tepidisphaeraceae bacterium]